MTNRITPYEAGWLGLLVKQGICTAEEAREAQNRVAIAFLDEIERLRRRKRRARKNRRKPG